MNLLFDLILKLINQYKSEQNLKLNLFKTISSQIYNPICGEKKSMNPNLFFNVNLNQALICLRKK
jgi:hypothetical protein